MSFLHGKCRDPFCPHNVGLFLYLAGISGIWQDFTCIYRDLAGFAGIYRDLAGFGGILAGFSGI